MIPIVEFPSFVLSVNKESVATLFLCVLLNCDVSVHWNSFWTYWCVPWVRETFFVPLSSPFLARYLRIAKFLGRKMYNTIELWFLGLITARCFISIRSIRLCVNSYRVFFLRLVRNGKAETQHRKKNPITFLVLSLCRRRNALLNLSREDGDTIRYVNLLSISFPRGWMKSNFQQYVFPFSEAISLCLKWKFNKGFTQIAQKSNGKRRRYTKVIVHNSRCGLIDFFRVVAKSVLKRQVGRVRLYGKIFHVYRGKLFISLDSIY